MKNFIFSIFLFFSGFLISYSQLNATASLLTGNIEDGEKLLGAYAAPLLNSYGACIGSGWYNTAKPHKLGGVDLTFTSSFALMPGADKTYNFDELNLNASYTENEAPSFSGKREVGPLLTYDYGSGIKHSYNVPQGTGVSVAFLPMATIGVGLFKNTEIRGRYVPEMTVGKRGKIGLWGLGLKHDLKQWIPLFKKMPKFNIGAIATYTRFNSVIPMNVTPELVGLSYSGNADFSKQELSLLMTNLTSSLLFSVDLPIVSFFGGAGLNYTTSKLALEGNYPVIDNAGNASAVSNPLNINIKSEEGSLIKPRLNAGIRFKFGFFTTHIDYTYSYYSVLSGGVGLSFR